MAATVSPPRNKNWLLIKFREWHSWGGLFLSAFIMLVAVTGILLNHKDFFFHSGKGESKKVTGLLTVSSDLSTIPISFVDALAMARDYYGDTPIEKIELKDERGVLIYKVAKGEGEEIRIDALTGAISTKYGMKVAQASLGGPASPSPTGLSSLNWAKIVDDLHTGKILGSPGKLVIDLTSGVIIALTLSGIYLWGVPILRKRSSQRRQASSRIASVPASPPSASSSALLDRLAARKAAQAAARRTTGIEAQSTVVPESQTSPLPEPEPALR